VEETEEGMRINNMCDTIRHFSSLTTSSSTTTIHNNIIISPSIECYHHDATSSISFDIVRILPSIGPVIDVVESIVLVVGSSDSEDNYHDSDGSYHGSNNDSNNDEWYTNSDMNASLLHLISKLGNRHDAPWLSKVVLIVSPSKSTKQIMNATEMTTTTTKTSQQQRHGSRASLPSVVDAFIASYLGGGGTQHSSSKGGGGSSTAKMGIVRPLPPDFTYPMIRSLLVIHDNNTHHQQQEEELSTSATMKEMGSTTEVRIVPHGIGGALPNLDLVFATLFSFQSHPPGGTNDRSSSIYYGNSEFAVHPFSLDNRGALKTMEKRMISFLTCMVNSIGINDGPMMVERYVKDWMGLVGFGLGMVIGP